MSPRSAEYLAVARERLRAARLLLEADLATPSVGQAYFAMLNAARAALSERERFTRTHAGTWQLFRETFVLSGEIEPLHQAAAQRCRELRERTDYQAAAIRASEAAELVASTEAFVAEVERVLDGA